MAEQPWMSPAAAAGRRQAVMAFVSRGFRGRRTADADPARVPPGQYVTRDFPVLSAGPTPHTSLELWDFSIVGEVDEPRGWTLGGVPRPAERGDHPRHPLRDQVVEARHRLAGRLGRHAARRGRDDGRVRRPVLATAATRPTCRSRTSPAARRGSCSTTTASRSRPSTAAPRACSCRTSTSGRAPSGCAACACSRRDEPGFWETNGYHNYGDPWREQRYWGD